MQFLKRAQLQKPPREYGCWEGRLRKAAFSVRGLSMPWRLKEEVRLLPIPTGVLVDRVQALVRRVGSPWPCALWTLRLRH